MRKKGDKKMYSFSSYEEIQEKHPFDGVHNYCYIVVKRKEDCLTETNLKFFKSKYPNGYFDKENNKYIFNYIWSYEIYNSYCYDGECWYLGLSTYNKTIYPVYDLPNYGKVCTQDGKESFTFHTLEEAEKYLKYLESSENLLKF